MVELIPKPWVRSLYLFIIIKYDFRIEKNFFSIKYKLNSLKFGPFRFQKVDRPIYLGYVVCTGNDVSLEVNRRIINANRSYF